MDEKKLQQEFIQFLSEKLQAKDEQDLRDKVKDLSQDDMEKYYEEFSKKKLKKAAHGSKLQYFKRLKHQCAEDEELAYFKNGGSVGCGCVKKKMEGGEVPKKPTSIISRAKNVIEQKRKELKQLPDKNGEYTTPNGIRVITKRGMKERQRVLDANKTEEETTPPSINKGVGKNEKGSKLKKNCGGATIKLKKKGGEVCPKCGKIHAAGTGCAAKFKMHRQGGNLNNISFFQNGGVNKKPIDNYYLTDYSEPNIQQKVKLNGKELNIKVNKGQQNGEDPITIQGNNYYLTGDSTLRKDNSIPYSFEQLRNAGIKKKAQGGSLNGIPFIRQELIKVE